MKVVLHQNRVVVIYLISLKYIKTNFFNQTFQKENIFKFS